MFVRMTCTLLIPLLMSVNLAITWVGGGLNLVLFFTRAVEVAHI